MLLVVTELLMQFVESLPIYIFVSFQSGHQHGSFIKGLFLMNLTDVMNKLRELRWWRLIVGNRKTEESSVSNYWTYFLQDVE